MTSSQSSDSEEWEEDDGMLESTPQIGGTDDAVADHTNPEVFKVIDFASAIRVNEKFKVIKFYWPNKSLSS